MEGFTMYVCFGRWGGFHVVWGGAATQLILGFVSIGFLFFDLEIFMKEIHKTLVAAEKEINKNEGSK